MCYVCVADDSTITGPMALKSYYAVSSYKDKKGAFSFNEGDVIQVIQKDPSGGSVSQEYSVTAIEMNTHYQECVVVWQWYGVCCTC